MSKKEIERHHILKKVLEKQITQLKAAEYLSVTDRQVRNLLRELKKHGPKGLISKKRGKTGNHQKPKEFKERVLYTVRTRYADFSPTFANEKLQENHGMRLSVETLRLWMIKSHLWVPRSKRKKTHPPRPRRECFGELIQVDGSHHHWFGDASKAVVLIVFIDDATGIITGAHFSERETLNSYFETLENHLNKYGRPRTIYSDRFRIFMSDREKLNKTQFETALARLDIRLILASSPQAKGRVERANRTLQDRLVKEMRLRNITTIEQANQFLLKFIPDFNRKFSKEPMSSFNAHRPLEKDHDLERILCRYEERTLSKDYTFQYHNRFYKIEEVSEIRRPKGTKIEVRVTRKGETQVFYKERQLKLKSLDEAYNKPPILDGKERNQWKTKTKRTVSKNHPWKRRYQMQQKLKEYAECVAV